MSNSSEVPYLLSLTTPNTNAAGDWSLVPERDEISSSAYGSRQPMSGDGLERGVNLRSFHALVASPYQMPLLDGGSLSP